ncbi:MAG: TetR/AcrR family transcriptional regulator [Burkholderiales bacterium]|nr:TetR/AcrR family transcriptional regulator [Burkholderiales bacterium]
MPRPSRNLDRALLAAGRALLPQRGCAGLSVREVAEAAGVNLGMFHYHFKTRDAFLRELLQSMYEEMFSQLTVTRDERGGAVESLRAAMRFLGRFLRANRPMLARVMADALCGDPIALEFLRANMPRHLGYMQQLIEIGQKEGALKPMPVPQALGFCAGSLAMPIIFGGAVAESGALGPAGTRKLEAALLSDAAIDQRIELALAAIGAANPSPGTARKATGRKKR